MPVGFRPIPVRSEHRREKGPRGPVRAHFCADRLAVEFFATGDRPNPLRWSPNSCQWFGRTTGAKKGSRGPVRANFYADRLAVEFFTTDAPNPLPMTQNSCRWVFGRFWFGRSTGAKNGSRGPVRAHFCAERLEVEFFATDRPNPLPRIQNSCW